MEDRNKHRLADWSQAPKWATHHAVDADGQGFWRGTRIGSDALGRWWHYAQHTPSGITHDLTGIDWRETLESRPSNDVTVELLEKTMLKQAEQLESLREENVRLHEKINRLTLESRPDPELSEGITALVEEIQALRRRLMRKEEPTVKTEWDIRKCFEQLRFDKDHHLGMGDIRITIGMQEEICELVERFYRCR
jgi:signal transduction histidine kinase